MSRVGKQPIKIPSEVKVTLSGNTFSATGPKGDLTLTFRPEIKLTIENGQILAETVDKTSRAKALHGLTRTLVANMIYGVNTGWNKGLELSGVGFRAQTDGETLTLNIGFSHPVVYKAPKGILFSVKETKINISGADKQLVGETAAQIRRLKPPEPYKGKGILYVGEKIRRKAGKTAKTGTGAVVGGAK